MTQSDKARAFAALHRPGTPIVLFNVWDAGGAVALQKAGAPAIATGSHGVAESMGFGDGEKAPLDDVLSLVRRVVTSVSLPVTVDFEGAYATDPAGAAANVSRLIDAGAVGLNIEDQVIGGTGLHAPDAQAARIAAIRAAAVARDVPLFINARTDLFLKSPPDQHAARVAEALARAALYATAGASGFFVPGLVDPDLLRAIVQGTSLPVNAIASPAQQPAAVLASLGVARISHGPFPWRAAMAGFVEGFRAATAHQS